MNKDATIYVDGLKTVFSNLTPAILMGELIAIAEMEKNQITDNGKLTAEILGRLSKIVFDENTNSLTGEYAFLQSMGIDNISWDEYTKDEKLGYSSNYETYIKPFVADISNLLNIKDANTFYPAAVVLKEKVASVGVNAILNNVSNMPELRDLALSMNAILPAISQLMLEEKEYTIMYAHIHNSTRKAEMADEARLLAEGKVTEEELENTKNMLKIKAMLSGRPSLYDEINIEELTNQLNTADVALAGSPTIH